MDIPRGSTIASPLPITNLHHGSERRLSRLNSQTSSKSGCTQTSTAIPGARMNDVPPALPPPRYNNDLENGIDLAFRWQNEDLLTGKRILPPIRSDSSLLGVCQSSEGQLLRDVDESINMSVDIDMDVDHDVKNHFPPRHYVPTGASIPSLVRRPPSSSGISQRLHGEKPLAQHNHNLSTHAYDQHLLLKIGKAHSPPGHAKSLSRDNPVVASKLAIQTGGPSLLFQPVHDYSSPSDAITNWMQSPTSAASPGPRFDCRDYSMNHHSTVESEVSTNSQVRTMPVRHSISSSRGPEDTRSRSERGSFDSTIFSAENDIINEEDSLTNLQVGEMSRGVLQQGTKRRALSPPTASTKAHKAGLSQVLSPTGSQPATRRTYDTGSLASTASSSQFGSYPSSNMLSTAPSSQTSISSGDMRKPQALVAQQPISLQPATTVVPLREAPTPSTTSASPSSAGTESQPLLSRLGNHYICSCCPKKPRKFENEDQLRVHETEKQYACAYCSNRFKNKNEAERHQNSLHLRRQSWSCAALSAYQAVFYPSTLSNSRNLAADTCGFCGDEFTNQPSNWDERIDHLTNVHKFGECNSTKKFFRADHFRQHLKHSHAGKSGKWTTILENNCQREEMPPDPAGLSPTASEHSQSGSSRQHHP